MLETIDHEIIMSLPCTLALLAIITLKKGVVSR